MVHLTPRLHQSEWLIEITGSEPKNERSCNCQQPSGIRPIRRREGTSHRPRPALAIAASDDNEVELRTSGNALGLAIGEALIEVFDGLLEDEN